MIDTFFKMPTQAQIDAAIEQLKEQMPNLTYPTPNLRYPFPKEWNCETTVTVKLCKGKCRHISLPPRLVRRRRHSKLRGCSGFGFGGLR